MPALENLIKAEDLIVALDAEFVANFKQDLDRLTEILGIFGPEVVAAGTALYKIKITGELGDGNVAEGDVTPLSNYKVTKDPIGEVKIQRYAKSTSAEAILKAGLRNAILRTDNEFVKQLRGGVLDKFFNFLKADDENSTATAENLQGIFAQMDAKLSDELEKNNDGASELVWFVNPYDIADYLAKAEVTVQNVFGMRYLESFLGVNNIFITNRIPAKTVYLTPTGNIHLYGVDFGSLSQSGLTYETQQSSIIGVHHEADYDRASAKTYAMVSANLLAEIKNYIVKGTISPLE